MSLTAVDWIALAVVAVSALGGWRRGLVASALSLGGLVAGGYLGSRIAPHLLHGGAGSPWTPFAGLIGAVVGAFVLQAAAGIAGSFIRGGLRFTPLRMLDSLGGLVLGGLTGLALVWVLSAIALVVPGATRFRADVQRSQIVRRLDEAVPPRRLLHLLARIDPFPSITGPAAPTQPLNPRIAGNSAVRRASADVVRVVGTACGVGVEGTGWFASPTLVVTAAHVVAGESDTGIEIPRVAGIRRARVVAFDVRNDVAVLRVGTAHAGYIRSAAPHPGAAVAIVGYPENGPLTATPGRVGRTAVVLTDDAYGHGPVPRAITALAGNIQHGDSGAPALDSVGAAETTVFAARVGAPGGYGVPSSLVLRALATARAAVSSGSCGG
ncbi:MAG: CvpA family protein [Gaiellaceae bacterium]